MKTGLLWFDDDPKRTLEEKVLRAAVHYEHNKHGHQPSLCFVHPSAFDGRKPPCHAGGVEIRPGHSVLPDHFWLGAAGEADQ